MSEKQAFYTDIAGNFTGPLINSGEAVLTAKTNLAKTPCGYGTILNVQSSPGVGEWSYSNGVLTAFDNGAFQTPDTDDGSPIVSSLNDRVFVTVSPDGEPDNVAPHMASGIYTITILGDGSTAAVLTRAFDANSADAVASGMFFPVLAGDAMSGLYILAQTPAAPTVLGTTVLNFRNTSEGGGGGGGSLFLGAAQGFASLSPVEASGFIYNPATKTLTSTTNTSVTNSIIGVNSGTALPLSSLVMLVIAGDTDPGTPWSAQSGYYEVTTAGDGSTPCVLTRDVSFSTDANLQDGVFVLVRQGYSAGLLVILTGYGGATTLDAVPLYFSSTSVIQPIPPPAIIPLTAYATNTGVLSVVARINFNPSLYAISGRTLAMSLETVGDVSVDGSIGSIVLYDLTAISAAATINVTSTSTTAQTTSVATPGSTHLYELRASLTGSGYLAFGANLQIVWS